jgi:hypothetical protein
MTLSIVFIACMPFRETNANDPRMAAAPVFDDLLPLLQHTSDELFYDLAFRFFLFD